MVARWHLGRATSTLVHILLQLGTFHAHYTDFCWHYMKYTRKLLSISVLVASVKRNHQAEHDD